MATLYAALGRQVYRWRWGMLAIALLLGMLGMAGAQRLPQVLYGSDIELPGTASHRVAQALRHDFKHPFAELAVVTTSSKRHGFQDPVYDRYLASLAERLRSMPEVQTVMSPPDTRDPRLVSPDGHHAILLVGLARHGIEEAERATPRLRAVVDAVSREHLARDPTLRWATTGRGALAYDINQLGARVSAAAEARAVPLTMGLLLLAFGALVAACIPLSMGLFATLLAMAVLSVVGMLTPLSSMVQNVSTMVGLAVGIDYSLLMVHRFREALGRGASVEDALSETMRTAGVAVTYSGLTVMIGMAGLWLTPSLDTRSTGLGGALVILMAVLVALTVLPAVLAVLGRRIDAPQPLSRWLARFDGSRTWARWAAAVTRHPVRSVAAGGVLLLALISPLSALSTHAEVSRWLPLSLEFHVGFDMLEEMGKKNASTPLQIVVRSEADSVVSPKHLESLFDLSRRLHADPRVLEVLGPVDLGPVAHGAQTHGSVPHGSATHGTSFSPDYYRALYGNPLLGNVLATRLKGTLLSQDGRQALISVVPRDEVRFEGTRALAHEIASWPAPGPGLRMEVGGQASFYNDLEAATARSFPAMVAFVVLATFVVLAWAYKSWLVPIKAILLNLGAVGAGYGALVMVFQWGIGRDLIGLTEPVQGIPLSVLVLIFGVVFGLSMDYEVFLISRIKEIYDQTRDNAYAIEAGLASTGRLITSAALIMGVIFGAFAWADFVVVRMLGVGMGVAVLVDALLIRVLLAPAVMRLAGKWNWVPGIRER